MHPQDTSFLVNGFKPTVAAADPRDVALFQQQRQMGAQSLQAGSMDLAQKQLELNDQQIFSGAMRDAGGDPRQAFMLAAQRGASGKSLINMQQMMLKNAETQSSIGKNNADAASANQTAMEKMNDLEAGITAALLNTAPDQRAAAYPAMRQKLIDAGTPGSQQLPLTYELYGGDPKLLQDHNMALTTKGQLEQQAANQKLAADQAEETRKEALQPSLLAKATNEAQTSQPNANGLTTEQQSAADAKKAELDEIKVRDAQAAKNEAAQRGIAQADLAIKQKTFDATFGGAAPTLGPDGKPLSGDAYLATLAPGRAAQVKAFANGSLTEADLPRGNAKQPFLDSVMQYDPSYNQQRAQTRKDFAPAGKSGQNIQALNTAVVHLDQLGQAAQALDNNTLKPGNQVLNDLRTMFGGAAPTNFEGVKSAVASEMASALKGNATDQEIEAMSKTVSSSSSPKQLAGIVDTNLHILGAKLNTKDEQYHTAVPTDTKYSPVLPTAQGVFDKHGIQPIQRLEVAPIALKDGTTLTPHSQAQADAFRKDHPELIK